MDAGQPVITCTDLGFRAGEKEILSSVNFKLRQGSILGIAGPSGSGKSTVLKIISSLLEPTRGEVFYYLEKQNDYDYREWRRKIAMFFQMPVSIGSTIRDNMTHNSYVRLTNDEIEELLSLCGLPGKKPDEKMDDLSIGEQQRLSLARIMVNKPEVLLLDEPTASLDNSTAKGIFRLIENLIRESNISVIFVSHTLDEIKQIANEVLFINKGKSLTQMPVKDFFDSNYSEIQKFISGDL